MSVNFSKIKLKNHIFFYTLKVPEEKLVGKVVKFIVVRYNFLISGFLLELVLGKGSPQSRGAELRVSSDQGPHSPSSIRATQGLAILFWGWVCLTVL